MVIKFSREVLSYEGSRRAPQILGFSTDSVTIVVECLLLFLTCLRKDSLEEWESAFCGSHNGKRRATFAWWKTGFSTRDPSNTSTVSRKTRGTRRGKISEKDPSGGAFNLGFLKWHFVRPALRNYLFVKVRNFYRLLPSFAF